MADQLKQFMMGLGFQLDTAGMAKLEAFVKNTEAYAKQSAANIDKLVKTLEGYTKGLNRTTSEAAKHKQSQEQQTKAARDFCKQLEECLKGIKGTVNALGDHREEQDKNTKSTDSGTQALRRHGEAHHRMRAVWQISKDAVFGFVGALGALAITGEESVRRVSKSFENLFYLSQRAGVTGHAIEALRFQFKSIGLDSADADQAIGSMADRIADLPSTLSVVSERIGHTVNNAGEAVTGLARRYQELLKTGSPADVAAFRDFLRMMGQNENVIAQLGRNIDAANTALELHHKILHDLGFGDGAKAAQALQERSVEFRKAWVGTQELLGKIAESFAGALMPGMTRFLTAVLGAHGIGDVNEAFEKLSTQFDNFIRDLVGEKGENVKGWFDAIKNGISGFATEFAKIDFKGLAKTLVDVTDAIIGLVGALTRLFAAYDPNKSLADQSVLGPVEKGGLREQRKGIVDLSAIDDFVARLFGNAPAVKGSEWGVRPEPPRVGHAAGGIVGINAHAGEAVLPASLTRLLMGAANQPQPFNAASGQTGLVNIIEQLSNQFDQWWSGSAAYSPIVQFAESVFTRLDTMFHLLLEDFGFVQKGAGPGESASAGSGGAESSGRPGGRFGGMGPGAGGAPGEGGTQAAPPGEEGQYRPKYKLGEADLSEKVINTIAGEATSSQESTDAVINNMFNRLGTKGYGPSGNLQEVASAPGQYAGYKKASAERAAQIRARIQAIASGSVPDATGGANEFRTGSYTGPWAQQHPNAPVIGGNRFAYNPAGGRSPYAPYGPGPGGGPGGGAGGPGGTASGPGAAAGPNAAANAVDAMLRLEGMGEHAPQIKQFLKAGGVGLDPRYAAWCAAFVSSAYQQFGIKGAGNIARDFLRAGKPVNDPRSAQKGDVVILPKGGTTGAGGHVGAATGNVRGDYIEMIQGNYSDRVARTWEHMSKVVVRRMEDTVRQIDPKAAPLGTDNMQRNLGAEKPAWRIERGADASGGDYGGGGDLPQAPRADSLNITVTTVGAAHGTGKTSYDMASRDSALKKRGRENNFV